MLVRQRCSIKCKSIMIYLNGFSNNKLSGEQFTAFQEEYGKLPSFFINVVNADDGSVNFKKLLLNKKIGNYGYYISVSENDYWISFFDYFLHFKTADVSQVDLYVNDVMMSREFKISYLLMQAYTYRLVNCNAMMIHSAVAIHNNQGILFCGVSGAGKSTQANLWKKYLNAWILNYDKPCIVKDGNNFIVHGSPWSGKENVFINDYVPIRAIVFVIQSKENKVARITPAKSFANLFLHNYIYPLSSEYEKKYSNIIEDISQSVDAYELYCDISEKAVKTLHKQLFPDENYIITKKVCSMTYKIKDGFEMKQIADEYVVIPRGTNALNFNSSVVFNESGAFLWSKLNDYSSVEMLSASLKQKYSIDYDLAKKDVESFIKKLLENGFLQEKDN